MQQRTMVPLIEVDSQIKTVLLIATTFLLYILNSNKSLKFDNSIKSAYLLTLKYYRNSQKHESTLLHTYVLNEFLTADH